MSRGQIRHDAIEQRLRDALEARADSVDVKDLRPAALPARRSWSFLPSRRTVTVLLGLAAAAACVLLFVRYGISDGPAHPAGTPSHAPTSPAPQAPASPAIPTTPSQGGRH
ncbi:hypothetical protein [Streptomyces griseorubiginosus]|uniref:hypothetical protein n=1 Tax=Streptomyces griseorubiginosus TaxID=67304 RepID=UPI0036E32F9F